MITKEQFKEDAFRCVVNEAQAQQRVKTHSGHRLIQEGDRLYTVFVKYVLGDGTPVLIGLVEDEIDKFFEHWEHQGRYGSFSIPRKGIYHLFTEKPYVNETV